MRAAYAAQRFDVSPSEAYRNLLKSDLGVDQAERYDETVLWFEADLFDQIILVYLLARLARTAPAARMSLICIGRHPAVPRFIGLGQLRAPQLAALFPARRPITREQLRFATAAWQALQEEDPRGVMELSRIRNRALPFLPAALTRYLQQYPWVGDGLSLTERLTLEEIVAAGQVTPHRLFSRVQRRERRPFMGDWMFYAVLRDLAAGPNPLIASDGSSLALLGPSGLEQSSIHATRLGERVLRGRADWRELNGAGKWLGGVYVSGSRQIWRWSPARARIIRAGR
jgi:hypothetical protein